ncbi:hypothetical protein EYC84_012113 [Monilinia fructicola]|uniref:Uncharacterized protein n=1 Tax=Monilinia fructicola TaxID=38448 RepID=A0A5M9J9Y6_MONFR|nr:hypothetical protein EYC84_012113 [Monilinia fructicola]
MAPSLHHGQLHLDLGSLHLNTTNYWTTIHTPTTRSDQPLNIEKATLHNFTRDHDRHKLFVNGNGGKMCSNLNLI